MTQGLPVLDQAVLASIQTHFSLIVFDTQGTVIWANEKFAKAMNYDLNEIIGMHHRSFCQPEFASSKDYEEFWRKLRRGQANQDKIQRVTKDGRTLILEATYMPVLVNDRVEAILKVATDITRRETLLQTSTLDLMAMIEEMTANTDEVLKSTEKIMDNMNSLNQESETVTQYVKSIQSVLTFVQSIASQSHLLGLNAAIESARAGEHGRGFAVVANEVRNMADFSKKSAEDIAMQLTAISNSIASMMKKITEITGQVTTNFSAMSELKEAYDQISETTENLSTNI